MSSLEDWGWEQFYAQQLLTDDPGQGQPGRINGEYKGLYRLICASGEYWGEPSGRLRHESAEDSNRPLVGDWVLVKPRPGEDRVIIQGLLERKNVLKRRVNRADRGPDWSGGDQGLAANLDQAFIVSSLNRDLNPRRLERYLALIYGCLIRPVIILSKADLCLDQDEALARVSAAAPGVEVLVVSVMAGHGLDRLEPYLGPGRTSVLLGSSGVGKTTLLNHLLGREALATGEIRADGDRGRHTTTSRHLFRLPQGGLIIDTPGLRAIGLSGGEEGLAGVFDDIERLSGRCRYQDCRHLAEPGCAVLAALADGTLDQGRYQGYLKLQKELDYQDRTENGPARRRQKQREKELSKLIKRHFKGR